MLTRPCSIRGRCSWIQKLDSSSRCSYLQLAQPPMLPCSQWPVLTPPPLWSRWAPLTPCCSRWCHSSEQWACPHFVAFLSLWWRQTNSAAMTSRTLCLVVTDHRSLLWYWFVFVCTLWHHMFEFCTFHHKHAISKNIYWLLIKTLEKEKNIKFTQRKQNTPILETNWDLYWEPVSPTAYVKNTNLISINSYWLILTCIDLILINMFLKHMWFSHCTLSDCFYAMAQFFMGQPMLKLTCNVLNQILTQPSIFDPLNTSDTTSESVH